MKRRRLAIWGGLLVSAAAIAWAAWDLDQAVLREHLVHVHWGLALLLMVPYWLHLVIRARRWQRLLDRFRTVGLGQAFGPMMIGFFGNNVLPAHMGELVRMYVGARQMGISNARVLATLVVERVMDIAAVAILVGVGLAMAPVAGRAMTSLGYAIAVTALLAIVLVVLAARHGKRGRELAAHLVRPLPERAAHWVLRNLEAFSEGLGATRGWSALLWMSTRSLVLWLLVSVSLHCSLLSVGASPPFSASLLLTGAVVFAVALPAAPGYFGTLQLGYVYALRPFGLSDETALAASIVFHLLTYVSVTVVGLWLLGRLHLSWRALKHEAEELAAGEAGDGPEHGSETRSRQR